MNDRSDTRGRAESESCSESEARYDAELKHNIRRHKRGMTAKPDSKIHEDPTSDSSECLRYTVTDPSALVPG